MYILAYTVSFTKLGFTVRFIQIEAEKKEKADKKYKEWLKDANRKVTSSSKQKTEMEKVCYYICTVSG